MDSPANRLCDAQSGNWLDFLFRGGRKKQYAKSSVIIEKDETADCAYLIDSGKVKIFLSDEHGRKVVLRVLKAGEYFGELALIDGRERYTTAKAMEDTTLTEIDRHAFRKCLQSHPEIAEHIMFDLTTRLREAYNKISGLALLTAQERVTNLLFDFARDYDGHLVVDEKLTHQHIANSIGASREMVTRILKKMVHDGHIKFEGKKIIILMKL